MPNPQRQQNPCKHGGVKITLTLRAYAPGTPGARNPYPRLFRRCNLHPFAFPKNPFKKKRGRKNYPNSEIFETGNHFNNEYRKTPQP
jgi:hypothetical protein